MRVEDIFSHDELRKIKNRIHPRSVHKKYKRFNNLTEEFLLILDSSHRELTREEMDLLIKHADVIGQLEPSLQELMIRGMKKIYEYRNTEI
jgi:hypothetical protein